MTDSDNNRRTLLAFLENAPKEAKMRPRNGAMELRDFFDKIIPLLGDMFDCKAQSKKEHKNSDTLRNLEEHIPKLVANHLHTIQRLGSYAAHEGQYHTEEYPLKKESIQHTVKIGKRIVDLYFPPPITEIGPPPGWTPTDSTTFIENIIDAYVCDYCDAIFGEPCVTKDGEEISEGREHTIRKQQYSQYRKRIQSSYGTTIIKAMHEYTLEMTLIGHNDVTSSQIIGWFKEKYPAYTEQAVRAHITMMCTNAHSRIHHSQHEKDECQLFFQPEKGAALYTLYNSEEHPSPIFRGLKPSPWPCPICTTFNSRDYGACFACGYQGRTNDRF